MQPLARPPHTHTNTTTHERAEVHYDNVYTHDARGHHHHQEAVYHGDHGDQAHYDEHAQAHGHYDVHEQHAQHEQQQAHDAHARDAHAFAYEAHGHEAHPAHADHAGHASLLHDAHAAHAHDAAYHEIDEELRWHLENNPLPDPSEDASHHIDHVHAPRYLHHPDHARPQGLYTLVSRQCQYCNYKSMMLGAAVAE